MAALRRVPDHRIEVHLGNFEMREEIPETSRYEPSPFLSLGVKKKLRVTSERPRSQSQGFRQNANEGHDKDGGLSSPRRLRLRYDGVIKLLASSFIRGVYSPCAGRVCRRSRWDRATLGASVHAEALDYDDDDNNNVNNSRRVVTACSQSEVKGHGVNG
ncbi:hypothetical protein EYF80_050710 [Liparis tanakae]|uniref:Uncharacterized protein n=1 Tax=Liparis tanakae TaxID=230148 RepID=A0A4Z2FE07_9TELE|nr:hypothetical protein EYF80_050710 [Liparis tanakae]